MKFLFCLKEAIKKLNDKDLVMLLKAICHYLAISRLRKANIVPCCVAQNTEAHKMSLLSVVTKSSFVASVSDFLLISSLISDFIKLTSCSVFCSPSFFFNTLNSCISIMVIIEIKNQYSTGIPILYPKYST